MLGDGSANERKFQEFDSPTFSFPTHIVALCELLGSDHLSSQVFLFSPQLDKFFQNLRLHFDVDRDWSQRAVHQLGRMVDDVTVNNYHVQTLG